MANCFEELSALALDSEHAPTLVEAADAYEKDGVKRMIKLWKSFAVYLPSPAREIETTHPFQTLPPIAWVRSYMTWRLYTAKPKLGTMITVTTLLKEFEQLKRTLGLALKESWSSKECVVMKKFIRDLKNKGASTIMRSKTIAYGLDTDEIQFYLWNCSERVYLHPRTMVQLSFWLDIATIWGTRPGEIVQSCSHRGSNEGIHYGDVILSLAVNESVLRYEISIALRNRKFCRNDDGKVKRITLTEESDPKTRWRCPVRKFLALALADGVFVHQQAPEDFDDRWILPTAGSRNIEIRADKKDLPIFRRLEGNRVSSTKIMSASGTTQLLKDICEQCGYTDNVTAYTFRRGFANKAEATTTAKKVKESLGHHGERTWHAYAAPKMSLDAQSIAYGKPENHAYTEFSQSIAFTRDFGGPKPANAKVGILLQPSKEILRAVAAAYPRSRNCMILRKARQTQFKLDRVDYKTKTGHVKPYLEQTDTPSSEASNFCDSHQGDVSSSTNEGAHGEVIDISSRPKPSPEFRQIMKYNTLQAQVIKALWHGTGATMAESIRPLMSLAKPEPFRVLYGSPIQPPTKDEKCPYCKKDLTKLKLQKYALHMLKCYCLEQNGAFCFDCATFIGRERHNCPDFDVSSQSYGVLIWRGLLIREGRCPYIPKCCITKRWSDPATLKGHIETHLNRFPEGALQCPHSTCRVTYCTKHELRIHLQDVHRIQLISGRNLFEEIRTTGTEL